MPINDVIRKNIFACLFSVHNTISLSRHEQVCLMRLRFERSISRNVASLNILVHDVINLLYNDVISVNFKIVYVCTKNRENKNSKTKIVVPFIYSSFIL